MKNSDIKHPYILKTRDGQKYTVLHFCDENGWLAESQSSVISELLYHDDLVVSDKFISDNDIVEVIDYDGTILWMRFV